ncbi:hypothetical protein CNX65_16535 [Actinosynnema pretiosum]|uniref:Uncharacterized protein n=2 Tax=Actinosynnema pretiosum TaxID=42197 RepID=A0A290Z6Q8_9PSEU|nr:hypothetical protein CNX65_16535 [Actinosynnema pretiosum]
MVVDMTRTGSAQAPLGGPPAAGAPSWSGWSLAGGGDARPVAEVLPPVVRELRARDRGAHWSFLRGTGVALWLGTTEAARGPVLAVLRAEAAARELRVDPAGEGLPGGPVEPLVEVATASSELALDVAAAVGPAWGEDPGGSGAQATVRRHLAELVALAPEPARPAFLFHCWQSWGRPLSPAARTEAAVAAQGPSPGGRVVGSAGAWRRYLEQLRTAADRRRPALPVLFEQATLTHNRLGVGAAVAARAALALRTALVTGAACG